MSRKALGRGLSALIPSEPKSKASTNLEPGAPPPPPSAGDYFLCPIERVHPQKGQPRRFFDEQRLEELVQSIREQGLVQPLIVRTDRNGDFTLIAGERRWRAAQRAALHEVPVVIRDANDQEAFELALVENLQREDLNPVEEAEAFQRLIDDVGYTQDEVAARVGRDRSTVANSLRLLKLPEVAQRALIAGLISSGHGRALLALDKPRQIQRVLKQVVDKRLSVREAESLVRKQRADAKPANAAPSANMQDLQERLSRGLQTRVRLHGSGERGRIEIRYGSLDELDRLLEVLLP
ncbi:MAG: ParB/RepB/Spo0J family partition protein [Deltaproteobacteria bacterium]|nr:ParB/RepB/Spo0J family partition protein [Deltaproteobacteria bacterium]